MNTIHVDHRGLAVEEAYRQLPAALASHKGGKEIDKTIRNTGVIRKSLEFGDVEWEGKRDPYFVELKLVDDFLTSIMSGHMQDQEARLLELPGEKKVVLIGTVTPGSRGECITQRGDGVPVPAGLTTTERPEFHFLQTLVESTARVFEYPYTGYVNYQSHLQERGIEVIHVSSLSAIGLSLYALYARSMRSAGTNRVVRRQMVSLNPEANAVKALFPGSNLSAEACETIAKVAGVKLGQDWLEHYRNEAGRIVIKDVVAALPGVGRGTIRSLFGV